MAATKRPAKSGKATKASALTTKPVRRKVKDPATALEFEFYEFLAAAVGDAYAFVSVATMEVEGLAAASSQIMDPDVLVEALRQGLKAWRNYGKANAKRRFVEAMNAVCKVVAVMPRSAALDVDCVRTS